MHASSLYSNRQQQRLFAVGSLSALVLLFIIISSYRSNKNKSFDDKSESIGEHHLVASTAKEQFSSVRKHGAIGSEIISGRLVMWERVDGAKDTMGPSKFSRAKEKALIAFPGCRHSPLDYWPNDKHCKSCKGG